MPRRAPEPDEEDDDLDEAERGETAEDEDDDEDDAPAAPKAKPAPPSTRATPEETRALDLRIFEAADRLEAKLGRAPTLPEIANAAKVPGASADSRRIRVGKAMRRRGLLVAPPLPPAPPPPQAKRVQAAPVAPKPGPAPAPSAGPTPGVRAVEALRDRLRHQLEAVEVTLAALRGES